MEKGEYTGVFLQKKKVKLLRQILTKGQVYDNFSRALKGAYYMKTKSMTEGNSLSLILKFALPLMAGNVFQELYTITDTVIVGQFLGVDALAAIGSGGWITWMLISVLCGITQGFSVLAAQCFGANDKEGIRKHMGNSILLSVIICAFIVIGGELILAPLLKLLNTPKEIYDDALLYLRLYYAGCPILMTYNYAAAHLRAFGNSSAPLRAMIIASVVNIALDILFVGPFGWGIAGAMIATLIAQMVAAVYSVYYLANINFIYFSKRELKLSPRLCSKQLYIAAPMAIQNIIICVGGIVVQFVVNGYGVSYIAGVTATNRLYSLIETASISYGHAMTTFMGQNLGAGEIKRIKKGILSGNFIGLVTSFIIMTAMFIFGDIILGMFVTGTTKEIADTMAVANRYLMIMCAFLPVLYVLNIVKASIVGLGNSIIPMISSVGELIFRIAASFTLPVYFGKMNLFYAEPLAWIGAVLVLIPGYFYCIGKLKTGL